MKKSIKSFIGYIDTHNFSFRDKWVNSALSKLPSGAKLLVLQGWRQICIAFHPGGQGMGDFKKISKALLS